MMDAIIIGLLLAIVILLWRIEHKLDRWSFDTTALMRGIAEIKGEVKKRGAVTDPFKAANKSNTLGASSRHIVIRKTPDQIRNENFEEIRKGASYGHHS